MLFIWAGGGPGIPAPTSTGHRPESVRTEAAAPLRPPGARRAGPCVVRLATGLGGCTLRDRPASSAHVRRVRAGDSTPLLHPGIDTGGTAGPRAPAKVHPAASTPSRRTATARRPWTSRRPRRSRLPWRKANGSLSVAGLVDGDAGGPVGPDERRHDVRSKLGARGALQPPHGL